MGSWKRWWCWLAVWVGGSLPSAGLADPSSVQVEHHVALRREAGLLVLEYGAVAGELLQQAVWSDIDRNGNGFLETTEQQAHAEKLASALILRLNEMPVRWEPPTFQYPLAAEALGDPLTTFRVRMAVRLPQGQDCTLTLRNEALPQFPSAPAILTPGSGFTVASLTPDGRLLRAHLRLAAPDPAPTTPPQHVPSPSVSPSGPTPRLDPDKIFPRSGFTLAIPPDPPAPHPGPDILLLLLPAALAAGLLRSRATSLTTSLPGNPKATHIARYAVWMLGGWMMLQGSIRLAEASGWNVPAQTTLAAGVLAGLCGLLGLRQCLLPSNRTSHFPWPEVGVLASSLGIGGPVFSLAATISYVAALLYGAYKRSNSPIPSPKLHFLTALSAALLLAGGIRLVVWAVSHGNPASTLPGLF